MKKWGGERKDTDTRCVIEQVTSVGSPLELNPAGDLWAIVEYAPELSQPRSEEASVYIHQLIGWGQLPGYRLQFAFLESWMCSHGQNPWQVFAVNACRIEECVPRGALWEELAQEIPDLITTSVTGTWTPSELKGLCLHETQEHL